MPLRSRFVPHLIAALGLLVASACESPVVPAATPPPQEAAAARTTATPVSVTADLGAALSVKPMSGLLHGLGATSPIDSLIAPLRPATWRLGSFEHYDRVRRTGARVIMVLSDLWGYQRTGSVRWPYDDYAVWERFVDSVAVAHAGRPVVWDVWNEPDIDFFWPQGDSAQARFHETYRRAARVLRDRLGPDSWRWRSSRRGRPTRTRAPAGTTARAS
jgi:hypothetical protein